MYLYYTTYYGKPWVMGRRWFCDNDVRADMVYRDTMYILFTITIGKRRSVSGQHM